MTEPRDPTLDVLLDLDGQVLVVDPQGGHWVRFGVTRVPASPEKPHRLDYSLTLHGPDGELLVGFDNAHGGPEARQTAGPSPPSSDDQGVRLPRRRIAARKVLGHR